jgi:hypothetical protein
MLGGLLMTVLAGPKERNGGILPSGRPSPFSVPWHVCRQLCHVGTSVRGYAIHQGFAATTWTRLRGCRAAAVSSGGANGEPLGRGPGEGALATGGVGLGSGGGRVGVVSVITLDVLAVGAPLRAGRDGPHMLQ